MENKNLDCRSYKSVYVIEADGKCKIGMSGDVDQRVKTIKASGGFKSLRVFSTDKTSLASQIESKSHSDLKDKKIFSEWFDETFDECVSVVKGNFKYQPPSESEYDGESIGELISSINTKHAIHKNTQCADYAKEYDSAVEVAISAGEDEMLGILMDNKFYISIASILMIKSACFNSLCTQMNKAMSEQQEMISDLFGVISELKEK